jgi:hypothetical protein
MNNFLTGDNLVDYAKTIKSKKDFEYFLACLIQDYIQNQDEWQNLDLQSFLTGLIGFVADMSGYYENIGETDVFVENITWRIAAEMLLAATVYGS